MHQRAVRWRRPSCLARSLIFNQEVHPVFCRNPLFFLNYYLYKSGNQKGKPFGLKWFIPLGVSIGLFFDINVILIYIITFFPSILQKQRVSIIKKTLKSAKKYSKNNIYYHNNKINKNNISIHNILKCNKERGKITIVGNKKNIQSWCKNMVKYWDNTLIWSKKWVSLIKREKLCRNNWKIC